MSSIWPRSPGARSPVAGAFTSSESRSGDPSARAPPLRSGAQAYTVPLRGSRLRPKMSANSDG